MPPFRTRVFNLFFADSRLNLIVVASFLAFVITAFLFGTLTTNDTLIMEGKGNGPWYHVTFKSIDYAQKLIDTDVSVTAPKGQKELITYFNFVAYYANSTSSGWGRQQERLALTESNNHPSDLNPDSSVYEANRK